MPISQSHRFLPSYKQNSNNKVTITTNYPHKTPNLQNFQENQKNSGNLAQTNKLKNSKIIKTGLRRIIKGFKPASNSGFSQNSLISLNSDKLKSPLQGLGSAGVTSQTSNLKFDFSKKRTKGSGYTELTGSSTAFKNGVQMNKNISSEVRKYPYVRKASKSFKIQNQSKNLKFFCFNLF